MSDRQYKYARNAVEGELQATIRHQQLLIKTLVTALGTRHDKTFEVRVPCGVFASFDAFAPFAIAVDKISGDAVFSLGEPSLTDQFVRVQPNDFAESHLQTPMDAMRTLLFKACPHLINGANGHPTDRADARTILREMKKLGLTEGEVVP